MRDLRCIARGGTYVRVCKPDWIDCADTSYSKTHGGRWTPPGEFGALYLCATRAVAAAFVRAQHAGRAIGLFSLRPERRPQLQSFAMARAEYVDVVTDRGIAASGLPAHYPWNVDRHACWPVARIAFLRRIPGIASRSASECGPTSWIGEELAAFDLGQPPKAVGRRLPFSAWYPDLIPPPQRDFMR